MKLTIWIRPRSASDEKPVMRIDRKWESQDTPAIQRAGNKLLDAMGWNDKEDA